MIISGQDRHTVVIHGQGHDPEREEYLHRRLATALHLDLANPQPQLTVLPLQHAGLWRLPYGTVLLKLLGSKQGGDPCVVDDMLKK